MWIFWVGLLVVVIVVVLVIIYKVKEFLRRTSNTLFGTDSIADGINMQADELSTQPRSVDAMTKVYLPLIMKDFKEFNWMQFKQLSENMLRSAFMAKGSRDISLLTNASVDLNKQIALDIEAQLNKNEFEHYDDMKIHQTEITNYQKKDGACFIILQTAFEYYKYVTKNDEIILGSKTRRVQEKYNIELVYIQNHEIAQQHGYDGGMVGLKCPNCGGPVTNLGDKICSYCGTSVQEINIHVWNFNKFYEN